MVSLGPVLWEQKLWRGAQGSVFHLILQLIWMVPMFENPGSKSEVDKLQPVGQVRPSARHRMAGEQRRVFIYLNGEET